MLNTDNYFKLYVDKLRQYTSHPLSVFVLGSLMGIVFFLTFFGSEILDFTYVDWLLYGGDLSQHYFGWAFFRDSGWSYPIGKIENLAHPFGVAITYMDSIPLFAIPFKLFGVFLPAQFQYFGLFGLVSYALQGGISALIIRKFNKNILIILLLSIFFIFSPIMLSRMYSHTALAAHWLILFSFLPIIYLRWFKVNLIRPITLFTLAMVLGVLIHPYFIPMLALCLLVYTIITYKNIYTAIIKMAVPLASGLIVFAIIGGFSVKSVLSVNDLNIYQYNLNAPFNPFGFYSQFLRDQPQTGFGESFNYFGLGMLLLLPVVLFIFIYSHQHQKTLKKLIMNNKIKSLIIILLLTVYMIFTSGPKIYFGSVMLFEVNLPLMIENIWSTYRANARFYWVIYYASFVGIIGYILVTFKQKRVLFLLIFFTPFILLQISDLRFSSGVRGKKYNFYQQSHYKVDKTEINKWREHVAGKRHVVILDPSVPDFHFLASMSKNYNLTMSNGYFARSPIEKINSYRLNQIELLKSGRANMKDNIYISLDESIKEKINCKRCISEKVTNYYILKTE